jgi:hypothetical protein
MMVVGQMGNFWVGGWGGCRKAGRWAGTERVLWGFTNWISIDVSIDKDRLRDDIRKIFDEGMKEMMELWSALLRLGASGLTMDKEEGSNRKEIQEE